MITALYTGAIVRPIGVPAIPNGAVALRGDQIVAVGDAAALADLAGPQTRITRLSPEQTLDAFRRLRDDLLLNSMYLGATPNAVANMESLVQRFGSAPRAFLVVPMVGAFFIDFTNALIITTYINLVAP